MSTVEQQITEARGDAMRGLVVVVPEGATEEEWMAGRDGMVTASDFRSIAFGGLSTWRRLLTDKLNGSTFKGNRHTRRGHEREEYLLAWAQESFGGIRPNSALYAARENERIGATPDGIGWGHECGIFGVEVKSHDHSWGDRSDIPNEHMAQMQVGMFVLGADSWLYVWEVMGEDGEPTLDEPRHIWVPRDEELITRLKTQGEAFLEWWDNGAPELDDLPEEIDEAIATYTRAQQAEAAAKREKDAAGKVLKDWAAKDAAVGMPLRKTGSRAEVYFEPKPDAVVIDEDAWAEAEPVSYAEHVELRTRVATNEAAALLLYGKSKPVAAAFRVAPIKAGKK